MRGAGGRAQPRAEPEGTEGRTAGPGCCVGTAGPALGSGLLSPGF